MSRLKAIHSAGKEAFSWSRDDAVPVALILGSAIGMGVPLAAGVVTGRTEPGIIAALGGLAIGSAGEGVTLRSRATCLSYGILTGTLAVLAGSAAGGHGPAGAVTIVLFTVLAALVGSMGRTVARYGSMFIVLMVIGSSPVIAGTDHAAAVGLLFLAGSLWTAAVVVALFCLYFPGTTAAEPGVDSHPARQPRARPALHRRFAAVLYRRSAWEYALRIGLCMAAGEAVVLFWGQGQAYWIAVVIAIVVQRSPERTLGRLVGRGSGTLAGVIVASLLLLCSLPAGVLVLAITVLAGLRPLLKARNYALYSAVMTPLVLLLLSFGQPASLSLAGYRLADTMIGIAIAFVLGYLIWPLVRAGPAAPAPDGGDRR